MKHNRINILISTFTAIWLLTFLFTSFSHMGNAHHIFIPSEATDSASHSITHKSDSNNCPWAFADLMNISDEQTTVFTYYIVSSPHNAEISLCSFITETNHTSDSRAPPSTVI